MTMIYDLVVSPQLESVPEAGRGCHEGISTPHVFMPHAQRFAPLGLFS